MKAAKWNENSQKYEEYEPADIDAEEAVIGSCLIDPRIPPLVLQILSPDDFYRDKNIWLFAAIKHCFENGEEVNEITVGNRIKQQGLVEALGGIEYISYLIERTPTSVHAESYANVVRRCSQQRRLAIITSKLSDMALEGRYDPEEVVSTGIEKLLKENTDNQNQGPRPYIDLAQDYEDDFYNWIEGGFQPQGIKTGFQKLDTVLNGLRPGNLIVVAGRPSMGKTAFLLRLARNAAFKGNPPLFFSLEMEHRELIHRLVFAETRLDEQKVRGTHSEEERQELRQVYQEFYSLPMWIDDSPTITTKEAKTRTLSLMAKEDVKLVLFDHIALAGDSGYHTQNERVGAISQGLKQIARTCNVPVVAASQLSRDVAKVRSDHRPWLEDLRDSGELEQNADVVLGLYRPEYYFPKAKDGGQPPWRHFLEVEVLKQRQGKANPRGHFSTGLYYDASTGYMTDWLTDFPTIDV